MTGSRSARFRDPLTVAVGALAVHRLTRLAITDEALSRPRAAVRRWAEGDAYRPGHPAVEYLMTCPWCVSVWAAAAWAAAVAVAPAATAPVGAALAWSSVTGLLSSLE